MSDWSDEPEQSWVEQQRAKKKALAAKKKKEPESDWSDEAPVKPKKSVKKPAKDSFSDEEPPKKPVKSKKPAPKEEVWSDEEEKPVKPKKSTKPKKEEVWSDEEEIKPKKSSKPKKEEVWSDEEPVKKPVKSKKKPVEEDWSEDEKPVKPKKVEKPKKKVVEEDPWSDEETVKPKKKPEPVKPKKKVVEEPWSDEEEAKPKKVEKPKSKKPVVDEEAWSDEEPVKPKKSAKKPPKDSFSDEEPVKKPVKTKKPAPIDDPWSDEDESPPKKAEKPKKSAPPKKQDDGFSSEEEKPVKKPSPKPVKKPAPVKKDDDSDSDAWGSQKEDSKPKKFSKKAGSDSDNDSDDGGFGGSDKGSEAERTPVTYVPDYDAAEDDNLYNETCKKGLDFDNYEKININCTGYDEKDQFKGIKKWTDLDDLNDELYETIKKKMGWQKPTPIQKFSLPLMMQGRDIMGCAQTGSGKTGGFSIPVVNRILTENMMNEDKNSENGSDDGSDDGRRKPCCTPIALVCAPTRELVQQIQRDFVKLTKDTDIKVEYVVGGHAVRSQLDKIEGSHIIVATPGRLNDFVGKGKIVLDKLKFLIVDEADRMLEMGFMEILKDLAAKMPEREDRTTAMFSATFPDEVQKIAHDFLKENYVFVVVGIVGAAANSVEQRFIKIDGDVNKEDSLIDLLEDVKETGEKTVIFVETKRMADFWATKLSTLGFPSTSIHGDREQREREEALRTFRSGEHPILVATNVAARGIDIPEVMHVINHDLPKDIDEYVHRIGRTGRCGNKGRATSFYKSQYDKEKAEKICKILGMSGTSVPEWLKEDCEDADGVQPVGAGGEASDDDSEGW